MAFSLYNPTSLAHNLYIYLPSDFHLIKSYLEQTPFDPASMADLQKSKQPRQQPRSHQVVKATTAVTTGGSLLVVSSLTFTATVILLAVATPLLIIFSPVIVPAMITVHLLLMGFLASGGFGVTGITVMSWMYRYVH